MRIYSEEDFEKVAYSQNYVYRHPHCCGISCVHLRGEFVDADMLNFAIQYSLWLGQEEEEDVQTLLEISLTDRQINPEAEPDWCTTKGKEQAEEARAMLKEWDFRLVSSFVNPNSNNTVYVFHRLPEHNEDLEELKY